MDFPTPGSPARSRRLPATIPPPIAASNSAMPDGVPRAGVGSTVSRAGMSSDRRWVPWFCAATGARVAVNVPHAPHVVHCPSHLGCWASHCEQEYMVAAADLAMEGFGWVSVFQFHYSHE